MKLTFKQIDPFLKKPDPQALVILVYGPDEGLVRERGKILGKTVVKDLNDAFNVSLLRGDMLVEDQSRLSSEANAISMMGGRRLVRIEDAKDAISPMIRDYLAAPNENALIVIEAGDLGAKSALRLLCEKAANAASLPCYVDDERSVSTLARDQLRENGMTIAADALTALSVATAGDRGRVRSEIEKLITYMGDQKNISIEDVLACCGGTGEKSVEDLVYATAGGKPQDALRTYRALIGEGLPVIAILRGLQNHFRKLHLARARRDKGESAEMIAKDMRIFFKQEAAFVAQVSKWQAPALERVLMRLADIEAQSKRTHTPTETLCAQALLSISSR